MKKNAFLFFLVLLISNLPGCAVLFAQVSVTGQVFAEVVDVIDARETSQMNFGRFSPGPTGGEITITPQGEMFTSGTVMLSGGGHSPAAFYVTGGENVTFSITLPQGPVILNHIGDSKQMTLIDWTSFPPPGEGTGFLQDGSQVVNIGATLQVGIRNDNPAGLYTGSYAITFGYY